jgi:hypothetical protein
LIKIDIFNSETEEYYPKNKSYNIKNNTIELYAQVLIFAYQELILIPEFTEFVDTPKFYTFIP